MMTPRTEVHTAAAGGPLAGLLPQVTYGPMTTRMAIMALIMGGAEGAAGRRA